MMLKQTAFTSVGKVRESPPQVAQDSSLDKSGDHELSETKNGQMQFINELLDEEGAAEQEKESIRKQKQ